MTQSPIADQQINVIPNYLVQAVLVTLFCCQPFGVVSLVYATQVNTFLVGGFYNEAREASEKAREWLVMGFWLAIGLYAVIFFFIIIAVLAETM